MGDLLIQLALVVGSILAASFSQQLADEFKAWTPWLTRRLVALAVRILPENERERYNEEWLSFVDEMPGQIGKAIVSVGLIFGSLGISLGFPRQKNLTASNSAPLAPEQVSNTTRRLSMGLLPEPKSSPASFISSVLINGAILALMLYIGYTAKRVIMLHQP
jgi:hypothetical protein